MTRTYYVPLITDDRDPVNYVDAIVIHASSNADAADKARKWLKEIGRESWSVMETCITRL